MERVLVTRPQASATRTAEKLSAHGYRPLVLPLTRIQALSLDEWPDPREYDAIAITSANAVTHIPSTLVEKLTTLPSYAVGERTNEAARSVGLKVAGTGPGDAEGLVRHIVETLTPGLNILVLCGRVRRNILEHGLRETGFHPAILETYDTLVLSPSDAELTTILASEPVDAVLLHSASAAKAYSRLLARVSIAPLFKNARVIAISGRVAQCLPQPAFVHIAAEPTEESMFSLLAKTK
ncbi:uroporphyrinogen-III synthase [Chelativorans sp. YIM 93263]|uniref:uroporphyrinogen-III synthase n=1 Tax=Chelativorans sp. YIM 93263 TaxID=2906648 RepID=UPI002378DF53|nr:uroporphyrinogen-III synthase [Chelativorans sp. YIM 93263]